MSRAKGLESRTVVAAAAEEYLIRKHFLAGKILGP